MPHDPQTPPPRPEIRRIDVAIGVIARDNRILICQRKNNDSFGGFWEFPGGKCEPNETLEDCLVRELREELDIATRPIEKLASIQHDYPHVCLTLHAFLCEHLSGEPKMIECQDVRWVPAQQLPSFKFPPANESLLREVIRRFTSSADAP